MLYAAMSLEYRFQETRHLALFAAVSPMLKLHAYHRVASQQLLYVNSRLSGVAQEMLERFDFLGGRYSPLQ